jgi:hypothetical protein
MLGHLDLQQDASDLTLARELVARIIDERKHDMPHTLGHSSRRENGPLREIVGHERAKGFCRCEARNKGLLGG